MAAPVPANRAAPTGIMLEDGYQTLVTINAGGGTDIWEKTVTPPGIDGGDEIDITTMHNLVWRTRSPRALKTLTENTFTAGYDPDVYNAILAAINVRTTLTVTFPDGSQLAYFGYVKMFEPDELAEGTHPEATVTIVPTNYDPVNRVEAAPVLNSVEGT